MNQRSQSWQYGFWGQPVDLWILLRNFRLHPIHLDTTPLNLYGENEDKDEDDAENAENDDDTFQSIPRIQSWCVLSTRFKRCIQNP